MRSARGDAEWACQTSTIPPSAARSARCAYAGASLQRSTACPRGVAPLRPSRALRDNPVARPGGATTQSPHPSTGCAAHPPLLFLPPGHGLATTRYSSESLDITAYERNRERADRRCIEGALAVFLLTACHVERRGYPLQSRLPGRDDGGIISQPDHIERPPIGLTVSSSTPTMAPVIARPVVHGRGLPQGADTRHEIRPLYPRLMD
jgi:hypothetical protein